MSDYRFSAHLCVSKSERDATEDGVMAVLKGLSRNILKNLGDVELGKSLRIFIRDEEDKVVGGIIANLFGGWAYIALLWVDESLRGKGYGTKLLNRLETEAARLGCTHAHLDTYSFEARPFYEKAGYEVFGTLENYPPGHCKYFLRKKLAA